MVPLIVLFGARVGADGSASASLRRRVEGAVTAARAWPEAKLFCSGAAMGARPSEAAVMARLLVEAGVARERLVLDEESRDTLQTVVAASAYMWAHGLKRALVCTDKYHQPRAMALFFCLGVAAQAGPVREMRAEAGAFNWLFMSAREAAAIVYDVFVVVAKRDTLKRRIRASRF